MRKSLLLFGFLAGALGFTKAQNVNIPDANFKAYLVGNTAINTNGDSEIQVSEAVAFTGAIECPNMNIIDLTGIEAFVNLTVLKCESTLNNPNANKLTSLDISKNTALITVYCWYNQLTSLDVSKNTVLETLACYGNQLTSLDVTKNTLLRQLSCESNPLNTLDVTKNPALTYLECGNTNLTNLDISNNTLLENFWCYQNNLTSLDLSKHPALKFFMCFDNKLTSLNLKNGNNAVLQTMWARNNPNLTCIQVDNVDYANSQNVDDWMKDATASYSENCGLAVNDVEKSKTRIFPNPVKDILNIETQQKISKTEIYDIAGKLVKNTDGKDKKVSVSALSKGTYIIKLHTENGVTASKFIKN